MKCSDTTYLTDKLQKVLKGLIFIVWMYSLFTNKQSKPSSIFTSWRAKRRLTYLSTGARSTTMPIWSPLPAAASHPHPCDSRDYFLSHEAEKGISYWLACEIPSWFGRSRHREKKHFGVLANCPGNSLTISVTRPDGARLMTRWGLPTQLVTALHRHGCEAIKFLRKC